MCRSNARARASVRESAQWLVLLLQIFLISIEQNVMRFVNRISKYAFQSNEMQNISH